MDILDNRSGSTKPINQLDALDDGDEGDAIAQFACLVAAYRTANFTQATRHRNALKRLGWMVAPRGSWGRGEGVPR
jgi:hypothetical protein